MHPRFRVIPFFCRICNVSECGHKALVLHGLRVHLPYSHLGACVENRFTWDDSNLLLAHNWSAMDGALCGAAKKKVSFQSLVSLLWEPGVNSEEPCTGDIHWAACSCGRENAQQHKRHKIWFPLSFSTIIHSWVSPWFIFNTGENINVKGVNCRRVQSWLGVVSSQARNFHLCLPASLILSWSGSQSVSESVCESYSSNKTRGDSKQSEIIVFLLSFVHGILDTVVTIQQVSLK